MNDTASRAHHRTMLVMTGGGCSVAVKEDPDTVAARIQAALDRDGWFTATSDPEGGTIHVNAHQVMWVGRERTPVEQLTGG